MMSSPYRQKYRKNRRELKTLSPLMRAYIRRFSRFLRACPISCWEREMQLSAMIQMGRDGDKKRLYPETIFASDRQALGKALAQRLPHMGWLDGLFDVAEPLVYGLQLYLLLAAALWIYPATPVTANVSEAAFALTGRRQLLTVNYPALLLSLLVLGVIWRLLDRFLALRFTAFVCIILRLACLAAIGRWIYFPLGRRLAPWACTLPIWLIAAISLSALILFRLGRHLYRGRFGDEEEEE